LAYYHIGGWRFGVGATLTMYSLYYLLHWTSEPPNDLLVGALFPVGAWKAHTACELRNRLVSIDGELSATEFGSFRNAGFAMSDFLLGSCMALIAGWLFLIFLRPILDAFGDWNSILAATFLYVLLAIPCVWLTELAAGYCSVVWSESASREDNRFLSQQQLRWRKFKQEKRDTSVLSAFRPTAHEAMRAVSLTIAVPVSMFSLALAQ